MKPDGCACLAQMMHEYTGAQVLPEHMRMVAEGASGRCIMRAAQTGCDGIIGVFWGPDRADNGSFLPAAHGLKRAGVQVPAVLAEQDMPGGYGACLVEDLGQRNLLSLREAPRAEKRAAYVATMRQLHGLHCVEVDWPLQPEFDKELYLWEQGYFAEHFLQRHCGLSPAALRELMAAPAWQELAEYLAGLPRRPVHRDCQSQNVMLRGDEAWLIDFQGMRLGLPEYDLASLLYDPYMALSAEERADMLEEWSRITAEPLRRDVYAACAMQRIMQALGAFANIGYNAHKTWYLNLIPAGVQALQQVCAEAPPDSPAARLALCLTPIVAFSA